MSSSSRSRPVQPPSDQPTHQIAAGTHIGSVQMRVADLDTQVDFYQRLGFQLLDQSKTATVLGTGDRNLLHLVADSAAARRREAGLYHFAILLPSRLDLSRALRNISDTEIGLGGASDHGVSEALYLSDPEGNGIEIYRDRPRDQWTVRNGVLQMTTEPLDLQGLVSVSESAPPWKGFPAGTAIGHIHLHVADLDAAASFYEEVLGFDHVLRYGSQANFVAAGGYHHHIGMNTWGGPYPGRQKGTLGLDHYTVILPGSEDLDALVSRLDSANVAFQRPATSGLVVADSSNIEVRFMLQE